MGWDEIEALIRTTHVLTMCSTMITSRMSANANTHRPDCRSTAGGPAGCVEQHTARPWLPLTRVAARHWQTHGGGAGEPD